MIYDDGDALDRSWPGSCSQVAARWSKLTDNDVKFVDGHSEYLVSRLQERYGYSRERAEQECQALLDELEAHEPLDARDASRPADRDPEQTMPSGNARAYGSPAPQSTTSHTSSVSQGGSSRSG